jgi:UDP-N-acetylglucosamine--N-acetylmuramyl-(pentapeptide) pyrophosphoryl-undecaprenol N-acetylglucosamine transferase
MSERRPILIAAGGTGGHLFPAQALASELIARGHKVTLITDDRGMRWKDSFEGAEMRTTQSATTARRGLFGKISALMTIASAVVSNFIYLGKLKPTVVVGFGGYPSIPPMIASILRRVPRVIHEQNGVMGRANRALASHMSAVAVTLPNPVGIPPGAAKLQTHVGNPVRSDVIKKSKWLYHPPEPEGDINLLVFGGSQGATILSEVVPDAIGVLDEALRSRIKVCQQARPEDLEQVRKRYASIGTMALVEAFYNDMPARMRDAHLIISRSGASTVCELMVMGRPAILVPLPQALDGDQAANAKYLVEAGGAWLMPQNEMTVEVLARELKKLFADPAALAGAAASAKELGRPNAASELADLVESTALGKGGLLGKSKDAGMPDKGEDT